MTDNQMDGGSADGTATDANGGASENQSDKHPSFDAAMLQEGFDAINKNIQTLQSRVDGLQGQKDKKISGLEGKIAEYENLVERTGSKEGAIAQMNLQEQLSEMNSALQELRGSASTPTPGNGQGGAVNAANVVLEYGLDPKDPQLATIVNGKYQSSDEVELAVARYIKAQQKAPSPTPAQELAETGKLVHEDKNALIQELSQLQATNPLSPRIKIIEKELGWE